MPKHLAPWSIPAAGFLLLSTVGVAQGWSSLDTAPPGLVSIAYDSAHQRAVGLSALPAATWSFDGVRWRRHLPDGLAGQIPWLMAYDPLRAQSVALVDGQPYVSNGAGWIGLPVGSGPASGASAAFDGTTNQIIAFGGTLMSPTDMMMRWTGSAWLSMNPAVRPSPRMSAGLAFDPVRSRLVLFGGTTGAANLGDTWEWDGLQWVQRAPAVSPSARAGQLVFDPAAQEIVLLGGAIAFPGFLTDCWGWNGTSWTARGALPAVGSVRFQRAGNQQAVPVGYHDGSNLFLVTGDDRADVYRRSGSSWVPVWIDPLQAQPVGAMAYDPTRSEILLAGGKAGTDTWAWNGSWQLRSSSGPGARTFGAMAPLGTSMVLFGGEQAQQAVGDTWLWNGASWSQPALAVQPPPRAGHAMANVGNHVLLFGGSTPTMILADTWRFDGVQWTQLQPAHVPPARNLHGLAHDPIRQRTVMLGGQGQVGTPDDTWEWDGVDWNDMFATHPSAYWAPLVFDSVQGQVVSVAQDRVWNWNGSQWLPGPAERNDEAVGGGLAFDPIRQRLVVYSQRAITWVHGPTSALADIVLQSCGNRPDLRLFGRPAVGTTPQVHVEAAPNALAIVAYGLQPGLVNWAPGCDQQIMIGATFAGVLDARGQLSIPLAVPAALGFRGVQVLAQAAVLDGGPVFGASLSAALRLAIGD